MPCAGGRTSSQHPAVPRIWTLVTFAGIRRFTSSTLTTFPLASAGKRKALDHRAELATPEAKSSVAVRSFGVSVSVMRPTSPYLKAPLLAHSTTSPIACFLVVATRRAAVRNSFRSWLNPELAADSLPLLLAGGEAAASVGGFADPFPPFRAKVFSGGKDFVVIRGAVAAGIVSGGEPATGPSVVEEPFADAG